MAVPSADWWVKPPGLGAESLVKGPQELKRSQIVMNKFSGFCQKIVKIVRTRTRAYHYLSSIACWNFLGFTSKICLAHRQETHTMATPASHNSQ